MDKRDNPFASYSYLDSQRLKDTFFSPPKKKRKKKPHHKNLLILASIAVVVIITSAAVFFLTKYEFLVVARPKKPANADAYSLLYGKNFSSLDTSDTQKMQKGSSVIHITLTPKTPTTLTVTLKKPVDLAAGLLVVHLQKSSSPLTMKVTVRDGNFFSNSLYPATSEITDETTSYIKVPIDFKNTNLQNANLYRVNQITFSFCPVDSEKTQWVLIKDITLS